MDEKEINKQILKSYLQIIYRLSDEAYQQRVWVRHEGRECDDIDDTIGFFFDSGDPIFETPGRLKLTDYQFELLLKLRKKLDAFCDTFYVFWEYKSTVKLIELPEWQEIRNLSKEVLQAFNFKKIPEMDEETIKLVLDLFLKNIYYISSATYQEKAWVKHEGSESENLDDLINWFLFEENPIFESPEQFRCFKHYQFDSLITLRNKLEHFNILRSTQPHRTTKELIELPEWQEIRDLAKEILQTIDLTPKQTNLEIWRKKLQNEP